jgi:hypothetical protein
MNCTEARTNWMLYLDREGDPELHARIAGHLARCPACAEWFARQQRLEAAVRDRLAAGEATPALWDRVAKLLASHARQAEASGIDQARILGFGTVECRPVVVGGQLTRPSAHPSAHRGKAMSRTQHDFENNCRTEDELLVFLFIFDQLRRVMTTLQRHGLVSTWELDFAQVRGFSLVVTHSKLRKGSEKGRASVIWGFPDVVEDTRLRSSLYTRTHDLADAWVPHWIIDEFGAALECWAGFFRRPEWQNWRTIGAGEQDGICRWYGVGSNTNLQGLVRAVALLLIRINEIQGDAPEPAGDYTPASEFISLYVDPPRLEVKAGGSTQFRFRLLRTNVRGSIDVRFQAPPGVTLRTISMSADQSEGQGIVEANDTASGDYPAEAMAAIGQVTAVPHHITIRVKQ